MNNIDIWLPPLIAALAGTFLGWLLSLLSQNRYLNKAKSSTCVSLFAEINGIQNELSGTKKGIDDAKIKGNPDYTFFSTPPLQRKLLFQSFDISRYSSSLFLIDKDVVHLLVNFNKKLNWFNFSHEMLSGGGSGNPLTVSQVLEIRDSDQENGKLRVLFNAYYKALEELISEANELSKRLERA